MRNACKWTTCIYFHAVEIGEVPRRIISKSLLQIIKVDIEEAAGPLQVCASHNGWCEAAVQAVRCIFKEISAKRGATCGCNQRF